MAVVVWTGQCRMGLALASRRKIEACVPHLVVHRTSESLTPSHAVG
eukprot:CAMPEP_0119325232 /NCGR_PEP_ID=MMETSP1333-20130426/65294_1 /TAXON_ID=418940 /ORGANISM="Scyphosphaera apsteinii, Strain RCC1455" /LENGTH=45 /DNA_ID= /DNA_START= /DNA_END= /DNA_ORIENTATION=